MINVFNEVRLILNKNDFLSVFIKIGICCAILVCFYNLGKEIGAFIAENTK